MAGAVSHLAPHSAANLARHTIVGKAALVIVAAFVLATASGCLGFLRPRPPAPTGEPVQTAAPLPSNATPTPESTALSGTATEAATGEPSATVAAGTQEPSATATTPITATASTSLAAPPGAPVRIVIPDLKIDVQVVEMGWRAVQTADGLQSEWVIPDNEAGHHINSAALGEQNNIVISGHNNLGRHVFQPISLAWDDDHKERVDSLTDRSDVLNGQQIELYNAAGKRFDYTITGFYRLKDTGASLEQRVSNARFIQPTSEAQVTLVTCWPITSNTYRLVVTARPAGQQ